MSSISIQAARGAYGGDTLEDTVRRMAAATGCQRVYVYANDYGDRRTPSDFYRIERPEDQARLEASTTVHNVHLVFDHGEYWEPPALSSAGTRGASVLPLTWSRFVVGWEMRWAYDRPILLSVPMYLASWALVTLAFLHEEARILAGAGAPIDWSDTETLLSCAGLALSVVLSTSIFTGPVAWVIWSKLLDERHGYGWAIHAALCLALGVAIYLGI
ncbi:MAG TPA: hypothetical protein VMQ83_04815 [Gammaproteobacteria bacterium]|nr:hypothetical protein [Gammaproteobacteria bacterium]